MTKREITKSYFLYFIAGLCISLYGCISDNMDILERSHDFNRTQLQLEINKTTSRDGLRYESQIEVVRLLMFDQFTGKCIINQKLRINNSENISNLNNKKTLQFDPIKIAPGLYDLVLLANESSSISDLSAYRNALELVRNKIDLYRTEFIQIPYTYGENQTYTQPTGPLLMSAYLENVEVSTNHKDKPFRINTSLVSAMSLVEVVLKNKKENNSFVPTNKRVSKIILKNMVKHFSNPAMLELDTDSSDLLNIEHDIELSEEEYQKEEIATYRFFVPEVIREEDQNKPNPHPTALVLEGKGFSTSSKEFLFQTYKSHFINDLASFPRIFNSYSPVFRKEKTNNLVRNTLYRLTVNLTKPNKELDIQFEVLPWSVEESIRNYGEAEFNISFSGGTFQANNKQEILTSGQTPIRFTLNINEPYGANWRISLTNGLDYALRPLSTTSANTTGAVSGIVNPNSTYTFEVVPLKPFDERPNGIPRYTEIYLVIDGREEQLVPSLKEENKPSGPGYRYRIKQVE